MRFTRILAAAAVLLGASLTTYASAQVESTPIPAPNKPNFAPVEFLLGTWTCKTKSARRPAAYVTTFDLHPRSDGLLAQRDLHDG